MWRSRMIVVNARARHTNIKFAFVLYRSMPSPYLIKCMNASKIPRNDALYAVNRSRYCRTLPG